MNIVFMGTPDFAVPVLTNLISAGHNVLGVFSQPDKPKGRHYTLTPPPVKVCAEAHGIPVYQPESLKNGEALPILSKLCPDVIVVAAYGQILKTDVLDFPKHGCLNVHASLLPKYRGAAPIQRAIIDGEKKTGVCIMQMGPGLDSGDVISRREVEILENETGGELFDRLAQIGAELLCETLPMVEAGTITPVPQDDAQMTYASMLSKADCPIDFAKSDEAIHNQIRGLNPWPTATLTKDGEVFKVHESRLCDKTMEDTKPGTLVSERDRLFVVCGNKKLLELTVVQPFGSKRMSAADYLRGHKV